MRSMKKTLIVIGILALILAGVILVSYLIRQRESGNWLGASPSQIEKRTESDLSQTKTDNRGGIEITVTPKTIEADQPAEFAVTITAQKTSLDFDLVNVSKLTADSATLAAESWDGGRGGHQLEGTLRFGTLEKMPSRMTLRMTGIAGLNRTFEWGK